MPQHTEPSRSRQIAAVPTTKLSKKQLRFRQNLILAAIALGFACGPLALVVALSSSGGSAPTKVTAPTDAVAYATAIAEDFVAAEPTALPVADGADQTFGLTKQDIGVELEHDGLIYNRSVVSSVAGTRVDLIRFTVRRTQGDLLLTIPVTYSQSGDALLAAAPSLAPIEYPATGSVDTPSPDAGDDVANDVPRLVSERVELWAAAYASNDAQELKVLVDDADAPAGGTYEGLGGFTCPDGCTRIVWATPLTSDPSSAIVRVSAGFVDDGANKFVANNEFDLLVRGWRTDAPRVQAWGPAGSGPLLRPYLNNSAVS